MNIAKYAVFGNPVSHSKSPWIHAEFAKQTHQQIEYGKIEAPLDNFVAAIKQFFKTGGHGCNITLPFKEQAWQIVNTLSNRAEIAGAVNTIKLLENGELFGDNTDGIGLLNDISSNLEYDLTNKTILILGAGGAVRGILHPLLSAKPKAITIANRTKEKAQVLANEFSKFGTISGVGFMELPTIPFDIIFNGTSAQAKGETFALPSSLVSPSSLCYDLMYSTNLTAFLEWAKAQNVQNYSDGLGMLVEQAAEAFYLWRNVRPDTKPVLAKLRNSNSYKLIC